MHHIKKPLDCQALRKKKIQDSPVSGEKRQGPLETLMADLGGSKAELLNFYRETI